MSQIKENIEKDFKEAFKSRDSSTFEVLKMLKASIRNEEIANKNEGLSDGKIIELLQHEVKKRKEAAEGFEKGGNAGGAAKETAEIEVIQKYLPEQMGDEEIKGIIKGKIDQIGASSPSDIGKVMGVAMKDLKGKADGSKVKEIAAKLLS